MLAVLILWQLRNFGVASVGRYIPLFNLIDILQILVLAVMLYWSYRHQALWSKERSKYLYSVVAVIGFMLLTVIFARAIHHYQDITYAYSSLWQNNFFQTGLSLLWSIIAIILMLLSKRYTHRVLWMTGFGLLILVVLKLFFVELESSGTIERIISFMVVGSLLLLIGYFVPLPPDDETENVI